MVRRAREQGPQHVTLHGKDAVVVVSADDFAKLKPSPKGPGLIEMLQTSPLGDLEFDRVSVHAPVRLVDDL